jgi:16S rRNA (cytosine967-C5)-methyltransferase
VVKEVAQMRQPDGLRAWLLANNRRPALWLRVNRLRSERARLVSSLHEHPHQVRETEWCPEGLAVIGGGAVSELPGFAEGYFTIQDIAAQLIGRLADAHRGQLVLDACAAPGGKATHLAEQMGDCGTILAVDIHPAKTRLIQANASRLGLESVVCKTADATDRRAMENLLSEHRREDVDLAIIDAPCSGLGTLRRHPELRIRPPPAIDELCSVQRRLLDTTADLVRPGGVLIYSVCTVTRAEGPDQILSFLDRHTDFVVEPPSDQRLQSLIGTDKHLSGFIQTWTDLHDADSFFAIRLRKSGNFA